MKRNIVGFIILSIGIALLSVGVKYRKELWNGVRTVKAPAVVTVMMPKIEAKEEIKWLKTGEITVEHKWNYTATEASSGAYQFRDKENNILLIKFCNSPPPEMSEGSVVDIKYTITDKDCDNFINAKVYKEGK